MIKCLEWVIKTNTLRSDTIGMLCQHLHQVEPSLSGASELIYAT